MLAGVLEHQIFLSKISVDDFVAETDRAIGTPESSVGKSEYAVLLRQTLLREELRAVTRSLRQMGIAREDALRLISEFWEETSCENT